MSYEQFRNFVTETDYERIRECCKTGKIAVSVRETGEHSINRINQGAGMKPHTILEKSIKEKSIMAGYENTERKGDVGAAIAKFNGDMVEKELNISFDDVKGFVGSWDTNNKLKGLYLTTAGTEFYLAKGCTLEDGDNGRKYVKIKDFSKNKEAEAECFITGDYDIHDLIDYKFGKTSGKYTPVLEGSEFELRAINTLNTATGGNEVRKLEDVGEYNRFQHGAQYSYMAFAARMLFENKTKDANIIESVAKMMLPVAMCNKGEWVLIADDAALKKWYSENSVVMKNTWTTPEYFEKFIERHLQNQKYKSL